MRGALVALALTLAGCGGATLPPAGVLVHPTVHLVFWGASWDAPGYQARWSALFAGAGLDRLAEYGNRGANLAPVFQAPDGAPLNVSLDGNISIALDNYFSEGTVQPPGPESLYIVFLPSGELTRELIVSGAAGYHAAGNYHGTWYTLAVVEAGSRAEIIASHELYEAITDPYGLGVHVSGIAFPENEIGDVCEGKLDTFDGVTVQQLWSVAQGKCL